MEGEFLVIKDKTIIDFYKRHNLDITITNKIIIELLEKILIETKGAMTNMVTTEILQNLKQTNSEMVTLKQEISSMKQCQTHISGDISGLKDMMMKMNTDVSNSIISKLFDSQIAFILSISANCPYK